MNRNPFNQSHSNEQFQVNLNVNNQVVDSNGNNSNQLNILHANQCHEQVFTNPNSTHSKQNRDALKKIVQGTSVILTSTKRHPIPAIENHLYNQIRGTHGGNRYPTHNLLAQHHLNQAITNPISSNSQ